MFTGVEQFENDAARYRDIRRESERRRLWAGEGWSASKAIVAVRRAFEWLMRRYDRQGELCASGLMQACEMLSG
jgi:hypothetical protein